MRTDKVARLLRYRSPPRSDRRERRSAQADTIAPGGRPLAWDRHAYVPNGPLKYADPTGHYYCEEANSCAHNTYHTLSRSELLDSILDDYGVAISEPDWKDEDRAALVDAVYQVGAMLGRILGMSSDAAFRQVYNGVGFEFSSVECAKGCWGRTIDAHTIRFYSPASGRLDPRLVIHELGHAFNAAATNLLGKDLSPYNILAETYRNNPSFPHRSQGSPFGGFAGRAYGWQQSQDRNPGEEFADMFLGYTYGTFASNVAGETRRQWMDTTIFTMVRTMYFYSTGRLP